MQPKQLVALFTVGFTLAFSPAVFAADTRVVEDTLVLKDPTVASAGKWVFGGAVEGFYVYGPYKTRSSANDGTFEDGTIKGFKPGVNIFAGYGDFTFNYTYRQGNEKVDGLSHAPTTGFPLAFSHNVKLNQKENEISARWLIRDLSTSVFTPYLYIGYVDIRSDVTDTLTTPGLVWVGTGGSATLLTKTQWKGAMGGIGGIVPISDKVGFRVDGGVIGTRATWTAQNCATCAQVSGSGVGGRFTGTMYYNIADGWNVQLGGRYEYLNGGNAGGKYRSGVFAMVGYTFK